MSSPEVLDLEVLRDMGAVSGIGPGPETMQLIHLFLGEERPRLAQLDRLAAGRNAAELGRAAHTMAGSCAILGARQAHGLATALEQAAKVSDFKAVAAHLVELREAWARLEAALAEYQGRKPA